MTASHEPARLNIAVLTVSDSRTEANDTSGDFLASAAAEQGHQVSARAIVKDDVAKIRAQTCSWIADTRIGVVLITGGTGFSGRDSTPEAVEPLFDKAIPGFGELFRYLSWQEIGSSTVQSRATAGLSNNTLICCLPGSTGACKTAWQGILREQLDSTHKPCNFVAVLQTRGVNA